MVGQCQCFLLLLQQYFDATFHGFFGLRAAYALCPCAYYLNLFFPSSSPLCWWFRTAGLLNDMYIRIALNYFRSSYFFVFPSLIQCQGFQFYVKQQQNNSPIICTKHNSSKLTWFIYNCNCIRNWCTHGIICLAGLNTCLLCISHSRSKFKSGYPTALHSTSDVYERVLCRAKENKKSNNNRSKLLLTKISTTKMSFDLQTRFSPKKFILTRNHAKHTTHTHSLWNTVNNKQMLNACLIAKI